MSLNPSLIWLLAGSMLCLVELFVPTAFVVFTMGVSALVVALVALVIPLFPVQVVLWLALSTALVIGVRRILPPAKVAKRLDAVEARTLTEIPPGETGRILYEGNSWQACCDDETATIAPNQKVYVVRRQGNTLIVVPQTLIH